MFDNGETDDKPMPASNASKISHNVAATNAPASTVSDSMRDLKRWERMFLSYTEHISISGNRRHG
jgi:hypothetical protein